MRLARFIIPGGRQLEGVPEGQEFLVTSDGSRFSNKQVNWLPPVSPTQIFGLVLNYSDHADELGLSTTEDPVLLMKPVSSLLGNFGKILYPKGVKYMHYEGELAVVLGRQARHVKAAEVEHYIMGYTIANDVTVRDFITNTFRPPIKAKGFDTFCPLGPYLATPEEVGDPSKLTITTRVNGEIRQQGNTRNLIHSIPEIVEFISSFSTLQVGDVILTGTPKGISPIVPGDTVEITIDHIGTLINYVEEGAG